MEATYISSNSFSVEGLRTGDFVSGRRLKLDCGVDGIKYAAVVSSEFNTVTTVVIDEDELTSKLVGVMYSPVKPGISGNLPDHTHSASEGDGGYIAEPTYEFTGLTDTPTTYSGANGLYAVVSGTQIVFAEGSAIKEFKDLYDTADNYSDGFYAYSTSSGIEYSKPIISTEGPPLSSTADRLGMICIDKTNEVVYSKNRTIGAFGYDVKSLVIDMADAYTSNWYIALLSVELFFDGQLLELSPSDFTAYATSYYSGNEPEFAFDTSLPKIDIGSGSGVAWMSDRDKWTNQRLICVFNDVQKFDSIVINNFRRDDGYTEWGAKNAKIYTSSDYILDTSYGADIPNSTLIFDGVFDEHVPLNIIDDQVLELIVPEVDSGWDIVLDTKHTSSGDGPPINKVTDRLGMYYIDEINNTIYKKNLLVDYPAFYAKTVVVDMLSKQGSGSWLGIRSIEFYDIDKLVDVTEEDFTAYPTNSYSIEKHAKYVFDTSTSKTGSSAYTTWADDGYPPQRLICVFNEPVKFTRVVVNNFYNSGASDGNISMGIKDMKIFITDDIYTNVTANATVDNSSLIFDGAIAIHSNVDQIEDQELSLDGLPVQYTGWDAVLTTGDATSEDLATLSGTLRNQMDAMPDSFIALGDTPSTYSGTQDLFLKSTGDGMTFAAPPPSLYSSDTTPTVEDAAVIGDFMFVPTDGKIYEKNRLVPYPTYTAKSVIIDITNDHGSGDAWGTGIRSIEFFNLTELLPFTEDDLTGYGTKYGDTYSVSKAFDTTLSKIDGDSGNAWVTTQDPPLRVAVVFDTAFSFTDITINNFHKSGTDTAWGVKDIKIYITESVYTSTTYGADTSNFTLVFDGTVAEHVNSNVVDDQPLDLEEIPADSGWDVVLDIPKTFTVLEDAPSTYSGTEGYFLQSTGSGSNWVPVAIDKGMSELTDYNFGNNTISGTGDIHCNDLYTASNSIYIGGTKLSTASGTLVVNGKWISGSQGIFTDYGPPSIGLGAKDDYYINKTDKSLYGRYAVMRMTVKSVIFDIADNYGHDSYLALRHIAFLYENGLIDLDRNTDFDAYSTTIWVGAYYTYQLFHSDYRDNTTSQLGWVTNQATTNQRIIIVFTEPTTIDEIAISNYHWSGDATNYGAKNIKIHVSTDEITDTTYNASISNSALVFDGQIPQHVSENITDFQSPELTPPSNLSEWTKVFTVGDKVTIEDVTTLSGVLTDKINKIPTITTFSGLSDTPINYGFEGMVPQSTGSGIRWATLSGIQGQQLEDIVDVGNPSAGMYLKRNDANTAYEWVPNTVQFFKRKFELPIVNGDAQNGTTGWTNEVGSMATRSPGAKGTSNFFWGGQYSSTIASQNISLINPKFSTNAIDEDMCQLYIDYWVWGWSGDGDYVQIGARFKNEAGTVIGTDSYNSGEDFDAWTQRSWSIDIPAYARSVDILLKFTRVGGTDNNGYIDEIVPYVTAPSMYFADMIDIPEPEAGKILQRNEADTDYEWVTVSGVSAMSELTDYNFGSNTISGTGDIHCSEIYTASGTVYIGDLKLSTDGNSLLVDDSLPLAAPQIKSSMTLPELREDDKVGTWHIDEVSGKFYKKNRNINSPVGSAKSCILDIANNWGHAYTVAFRSLEFTIDGTVVPLSEANMTGYGSEYDSRFQVTNIFDTSLSKIGPAYESESGWQSAEGNSNIRIVVVFDNTVSFNGITVNNSHYAGSNTDKGIRDVKIYTTDSIYNNTTYNADIENLDLIFDGQFRRHVDSNVVDDQVLDITVPLSDTGWDLIFSNELPSTLTSLDTVLENSLEGKYLRTTASGVEAVDGVVLKAPNESEWMIRVTNSGTLYTVEV